MLMHNVPDVTHNTTARMSLCVHVKSFFVQLFPLFGAVIYKKHENNCQLPSSHCMNTLYVYFVQWPKVEVLDRVSPDCVTDTMELVVGGYTCLEREVMTLTYQAFCPQQ